MKLTKGEVVCASQMYTLELNNRDLTALYGLVYTNPLPPSNCQPLECLRAVQAELREILSDDPETGDAWYRLMGEGGGKGR